MRLTGLLGLLPSRGRPLGGGLLGCGCLGLGDPGRNELLDRGAFLGQLGVTGLVLGDLVGRCLFDGLPLAEQAANRRLLRSGSLLQRALGTQRGGCGSTVGGLPGFITTILQLWQWALR